MSDELPDDPQQWPKDPYELFQLGRPLEERALKRRYAQLLKRYKPEQKPEEFRLVRDAYETLRMHLSYQRFPPTESSSADQSPVVPTPESETKESAGNSDSDVGAKNTNENEQRLPRFLPLPIPPEEQWRERIAAGDEAGLYNELRETLRGEPTRATAAIRLYWLLRIKPNLEPERQPRDWLQQAIAAGSRHPTLVELYAREAHRNPSICYGADFERLLEQRDEEFVADCYRLRWTCSLRIGMTHTIPNDWERFCSDHTRAEPRLVVGLLCHAIECLLWNDSTDWQDPAGHQLIDVTQRLIRLLEDQAGDSPEGFGLLDRVEWLQMTATPLKTVQLRKNNAYELTVLLRLIAMPGPGDHTERAFKLLAQAEREPIRWLNQILQELEQVPGSPSLLLNQLTGLTGYHPQRELSDSDQRRLADWGKRYFDSLAKCDFVTVMSQLLAFCLRMRISPLQYLQLPGAEIRGQTALQGELFEVLSNATGLHLLYEMIDGIEV